MHFSHPQRTHSIRCNFYNRCHVFPKLFSIPLSRLPCVRVRRPCASVSHQLNACITFEPFLTFYTSSYTFFLWFIIIIAMILAQGVIKHSQWKCRRWKENVLLWNSNGTEQNINTHTHPHAYIPAPILPHLGSKRYRSHHHAFVCMCAVSSRMFFCRFLFHFNWWLCAIKQYYLHIEWEK